MAVPSRCTRSGPDSQPNFSHRFHKDGPSHSYPLDKSTPNNQWRPLDRKVGPVTPHREPGDSESPGKLKCIHIQLMEARSPCDVQGNKGDGKKPLLLQSEKPSLPSASPNARNWAGAGVLPSDGQAPHTARGRGCCPGCTGSYSQPGCAPAGASPLVTSFQNRCGFWKGIKQEQLHLTHLPRRATTHVTHHNQPCRSNSAGLQYI